MSACPACRSVSVITWRSVRWSVTAIRISFRMSPGRQPSASRGSASIVASEWAHTRRYRPTISSRVSSAVAQRSESGSASLPGTQGGSGPPNGLSYVSPRYTASAPVMCLTSPSRLVPVGVIGRRMSYSDSPSSFQSRVSRAS